MKKGKSNGENDLTMMALTKYNQVTKHIWLADSREAVMTSATSKILFHLAFPVTNIQEAKQFYREGLGCAVGRENETSVILNLQGHQLVAHLTHDLIEDQIGIYPRHFGLVFEDEKDWEALRDRAIAQHLTFRIEPKLRFPGSPLEHRTFFLEDPSHNLLEFKYYRHTEAIFGQQSLAMVGDRKP